jgi:hypothetical protein
MEFADCCWCFAQVDALKGHSFQAAKTRRNASKGRFVSDVLYQGTTLVVPKMPQKTQGL